MNAGAYGAEFKDIVVSSEILNKENLDLCSIDNSQHEFEYRGSKFSKNKDDIIVSTILQLSRGNKEEIKAKMDENNSLRKLKQPTNFASAGSTFKREKEYITAELIDKCDLKGYNIGDAYVSEKHAGFIVNKGNATAKDVLELINIVKKKVYERFNVEIELEIEVLGED